MVHINCKHKMITTTSVPMECCRKHKNGRNSVSSTPNEDMTVRKRRVNLPEYLGNDI